MFDGYRDAKSIVAIPFFLNPFCIGNTKAPSNPENVFFSFKYDVKTRFISVFANAVTEPTR